jgi:hypothetical protein
LVNETFDYVKYLDVKKSIDDRSLNEVVWGHFSNWLLSRNKQDSTLRVLEIGAGIGTMIERLLEASLLQKCHYIVLEPETMFKEAALSRFKGWANKYGCTFKINSEGLWHISNNELDIFIEWIEADANKIDQLFGDKSFDLLLSHAVIDLLPVPTIMSIILDKLKARGACYFSLNFSGNTEFYPAHDSDHKISELYHLDMDSRFPNLDWQPSLTGIALPIWLKKYGCEQVVDGESNWELGEGDSLFIKNILDTIKKALAGFPGLETWLSSRYKELDQEILAISISNRDCFGLK